MNLWKISLLSLCMGLPLYAEDHEAEHGDVVAAERFAGDHHGEHDDDHHREIEPLGRTLKLSFKAEPEEDEHSLSVVVATGEYGLSVSMDGEDEVFRFQVGGRLALLDDDRLGLTFDLNLGIGSEEGEVAYVAMGSTISRIGGKAALATFGEKTIYVYVTEESEIKKGGH